MKLEVQDLSVAYGPHTAVHEVSFSLQPGDILGLVGESGSGKSTVVNGLLRLLGPPARITSGRVTLGDLDLLKAGDDAIRASRWRDVSLVPQSALSALNPVLTVGAHFADTLPELDPLPALKSVGAKSESNVLSVDCEPYLPRCLPDRQRCSPVPCVPPKRK